MNISQICGQMYVFGTGSALNIPIGFIPDYARVVNIDDKDRIDEYYRGRLMAFTSGGTTEITKGMLIKGATSGAITRIQDVIIKTGSWAGGDAAGYFILDDGDPEKKGTFTTENIYCISDNVSGTDDASVVVDVVVPSIVINTAVGSGGDITAYLGDTSNAKGITIGATASENDKLLLVQWWVMERTNYRTSV